MNRSRQILVMLLCVASTFALVGAAQPTSDPHSAGLEALVAGDNQKAINLFSLAITANPDDFRSYNDRGVAFKMAGDLEKAIADYTRAIEIKPDYFNAWNNRGVLYLQQGKYDSAIKDFQEALKSEELKSKVYTNLGIAYAKKGNHHEAVEFLGAATAARPLDPRSFVFIAESLEQLGQNERALSMYQLALGLLRDTAITQSIEKRVDRLEKGAADSRASRTGTPSAEERFKRGSDKQPATKTNDSRVILPARSAPAAPVGQEQKPVHAQSAIPDTLEGLDQSCRSRAVEKMSPASVEIYQQGLQFLERSDTRQALIRFEDILQLERRKKNPTAVAWSTLEIARTYLKIGDYATADAKLQEALKFFRHLKAAQETILCLSEIAAARKAAGQGDKGALFYAQAAEQATTLGNERLVRDIQDHASGKVVRRERPPSRVASSSLTDGRTLIGDPRKPATGDKTAATARPSPAPTTATPKVEPPDKTGRKHPAWSDPGKTVAPTASVQPGTRESAAAPIASGKREPSSQKPERIVLQAPGPKVSEKPLAIETKVGGDRVVALGSPVSRHASSEAAGTRFDRRPSEPTARGRFDDKKAPTEAVIRGKLAELRKYRDAHDEANMVLVLEALSEAYIHERQYDKALHCLVASLAFREKLGLNKGIEKLYETRGSVREKLGDYAAAIEDLSRALVLSQDQRSSGGVMKGLAERIRRLAHSLGLDSSAAAHAYQSLWKARAREDARGETQALYLIGRLYDQADKLEQALIYYERTAASMMNDKARIYQKIGKKSLAEESYRSALESFKQLDYSRYLSLLKKSKTSGSLSRQ